MPSDLERRLTTALSGRYTILRELGHGAMAVVFLAEDVKHGRKVALKVLRPELSESLGADRFLREIRIAAGLSHPNIVTVLDSGAADGLLWYAMPYIEGESLRARLAREKQLPVGDALRIAREVADALAFAHAQGVVHRDIKPENILLAGGHAMVADFGVARAVSSSAGERLTETGLAIGTPAYMSPEQASGDAGIDARADQYALGCVTYEMLAGAPPFTAATAQALFARKMMERVPPIRVVRDTVAPGLEGAVIRAMAKVPADRYASVQEFASALSGEEGAGDAALARARRTRLAGSAAIVLIGVVLLGVRYARTWRARRAAPVAVGVKQITTDPGIEWYPSFSPDGQWIAYAGEAHGERDILLRSVKGENPIDLTPDTHADNDEPAFSPDGQRIAFSSERDSGGIFVMGRTGESPRRLTRAGHRPTWSPDGAQIAYASEKVELGPRNESIHSTVSVVNVTTGAVRTLSEDDAVMPAWSPHGARIAYVRRLLATGAVSIVTVPAAGGPAVPLTPGGAIDWGPAWSPDGRWVYFTSDRTGIPNLWRIAVDESSGQPLGAPQAVATPASSVAEPAVAPDGHHIAYASVAITINIQRAAFDPVTATMQGEPSWITSGSRRFSSPDPSPDGKWVTMYTLGLPEGKIFVARADGSELRQVTNDSVIERQPRWSPDGEWIAFFSTRNGAFEPWKVRRDGSELQRMAPLRSGSTSWSPDGSRAAVSSLDSSLIVVVFDPRAPWNAQRPDTLPPPPKAIGSLDVNSWSPDGRWLAGMVGNADKGVAVYSFATRTYTQLSTVGDWPVFLPDSKRILFVSEGKGFYVVDMRTKAVKRIFAVTRDVIGPPRITRDGREMYFSRRVTEADVWVVTVQ